MFRLQPGHLPEDPKFRADLAELGFFINHAGQFRLIKFPDKTFNYQFSNHERSNEVRREAYQICQRNEVLRRVDALGLKKLYLPQLTYTKPKGQAFVPILAPPAEILKTRKRVIVLVSDPLQDLGILAYRRLQRELGVNGGSIVNFIKELIKRSCEPQEDLDIFQDGVGVTDPAKETPGVIVMNCGQLLFSHKFAEAKTHTSWAAMPRKSEYHNTPMIVEENYVPGNRDAKEHIQFVIENVIKNRDYVAEDAEIYVIVLENGVRNLLSILNDDLEKYGSRFTAMAIINSQMHGCDIENPQLKAYLHQRAREWRVEAISDPRQCVDVPANYNQEVATLDQNKDATKSVGAGPVQPINWLEHVKSGLPSVGNALRSLTNQLKHLGLTGGSNEGSVEPPKATGDAPDATTLDSASGPLCPTFADDDNPHGAGECVFTSRSVQHAVLDFFEEVARDPMHYHNPTFQVAHPEAEAEDEDTMVNPLPEDVVSPEQADINTKKEQLEEMKAALRDTPADVEELKAGRDGLVKRIAKAEEEIDDLTKKALATGSLGAGEAQEARRKWEPATGGPKVKFAGSMVDSELLKAAGLEEIVEDDLQAQLENGLAEPKKVETTNSQQE